MKNKIPKVLISDNLSKKAVQIFRNNGIEVDFNPEIGKDKQGLAKIIGDYDGLAIRSTTKVTPNILKCAEKLRVIGRAGIGVDNVDVIAASRKGIIVMNTPLGNAITTAEHAIAMMMALARQIPQASASTRSGKWEKSRFTGIELAGKIMGVVGCGNIGSAVCQLARGLHMKVLGYDPFISEERATNLCIEKVDFEELIGQSDFISFHVPLTEKTKYILNQESIQKVKSGVHIINCSRGGVVEETALIEALKSGLVGGAALDVFEVEPPQDNPLLAIPEVIVTPHLGASTTEAQEKVALQIAEQMSDYLRNDAVTNALNMPSISADESPVLKPWVALADHLGSLVGQMTDVPIQAVNFLYDGSVAEMNTKALSAAATAGMLRPSNPDVNMVSAEVMAKERGFLTSATTQSQSGVFDAYMKIKVTAGGRERTVAGTVFSDGRPRFIQIKGIYLDAEVRQYMLYTTNKDVPGIIGTIGTILGKRNVNIGNFSLGRSDKGEDAIALLSLDEPPEASVLDSIRATNLFQHVKLLQFNVHSN